MYNVYRNQGLNIMKYIFIIYILVGIFTFGHSYSNQTVNGRTHMDRVIQKTLGGILSGTVWPLYWSVNIQS